jgi:putative alpha-1,2-mannosidase
LPVIRQLIFEGKQKEAEAIANRVIITKNSHGQMFEPGTKENPDLGYRSRFLKNTEIARPGYYAVNLEDCDVYAEMTASARVGFHRYRFQDNRDAGLIIDLGHGIGDKTLKSSIKIVDDYTVTGYRRSTARLKPYPYCKLPHSSLI